MTNSCPNFNKTDFKQNVTAALYKRTASQSIRHKNGPIPPTEKIHRFATNVQRFLRCPIKLGQQRMLSRKIRGLLSDA